MIINDCRGLRKDFIYQTDEFVVVEAGKVEDLNRAETFYLRLCGGPEDGNGSRRGETWIELHPRGTKAL